MTRLQEALESLGLEAEIALSGQWAKLDGKQCKVHIVEVGWGIFYNTWCEDPGDSTVHVYCDPVEAIDAGLRRASLPIDLCFPTPGTWETDGGHQRATQIITTYTESYGQA
jgi:hypothetical protein